MASEISSSNDAEKNQVTLTEDANRQHGAEGERTFEVDQEALPPGYYKSTFFWGSMTGIGLGLFAGVSAFGYAAPILGIINADIGPDPNITWVALSYTLTSAVVLAIIGRISDIFGRRYVFIAGAVLGVIGSIVCATAQTVNTLIGGTAILGIASGTQVSYYYVMGELVPMKHRLAGNAYCYILQYPGSGVAPVVAHAFLQYQPNIGWRGCYYVLIAVNAASLACWVIFYHPPTFHMKHPGAKVLEYIKHFDYVGLILYSGGLLIFLMGLNWGGTVYPWNSAYVIATIVVGFSALVALVLWESFMDLKEPLMPMHIFNNRGWNCATIISGLGASMYYAFAIVWPSMVAVLYTDGNVMSGAWLASLIGLMIITGEVVGGLVAKYIMYIKWQIVVTILLGGIFYGLIATSTVESKARASALVALGTFFIGWTESLAITAVTLTAKNQNELGTASGLAGSIRYLISSISATVYTIVLSSRLGATIPERVPPALADAGLSSSSIPDFITAITTTGNFTGISGITPAIIATGTRAYQEANVSAYRTVFLTTIAFTGVAVICALLLPGLDHYLTGKVAATLHKSGKEDEIIGS